MTDEKLEPGAPPGGNYDPYVALEFFKSTGDPVDVKEGKTLFEQSEKEIPVLRRNKMYLLLKGEAALVDGATRLANAMAETDCELLPITRPAFLELVKFSPDFAQAILASLSERLRFLTARLD